MRLSCLLAVPAHRIRLLAGLATGAMLALAGWLLRDVLPAPAALALLAGGAVAGAVLARWQVLSLLGRSLPELLTEAGGRRGPAPDQAASARPRPAVPGLQALTDGLQRLLARQQALFDAQAAQLETLRQLAHSDALTGLPNRRHFLARLDALLGSAAAPRQAGLVLLRLRDLQGMNQRIGRAAADNVLRAVGQALQAYPGRIERCVVGRLNGADFALLLPVGGLAAETAQSLLQALHASIGRIDAQARVVAGAVELRPPLQVEQALSLADEALARAEAAGGRAVPLPEEQPPVVSPRAAPQAGRPQGESAWQRRLTRALDLGRVALGEFPVFGADGRRLHLDCPLRVQLHAGGPLEPAARWLALAHRTRLCAAVDEKAVALALSAIARDGVARCVNVAAQSLVSAEFVAMVSRRLEAAPDAACRLWIDLPEPLALERPLLLREVSRRWRPLGVMLSLEHAGEALARVPQLMDLGLDCVRIDSRFVNGIAAPEGEAARHYLQGLVRLVQSMGLQVSAEGVRSIDDLVPLWAMGFDAATGPALNETSVVA